MQPGDRLVFYEISPRVVDIAKREFTFLEYSAAHSEIVMGDGTIQYVPLMCRIDTLDELDYFRNGGILQTFSPAREGTPSFHVDKIYYTLLPHLFGATYFGQLSASPWSGDGPVYFFTRFGEFFFDAALRP